MFEPVYMSKKKNTPVIYNLAAFGLSDATSHSKCATFSTRIGSNVNKSWTT
jgi:hypothetical protein